MATKILDLELQKLPTEINGLEKYNNALILIRLNGRPIGQTLIPIKDGRITESELREVVMDSPGLSVYEYWLRDFIEIEPSGSHRNSQLKATVAICTRDRTEDLQRCLDALVKLPDDGQEILVVDNCPSTDATYKLVMGYKQVSYLREDKPGLSCARNKALREAKHPIVAFTDDDAIPDPGWLRALLKNFDDPLVLCTTGLTMPFELENEIQEWFERMSCFAHGFKRTVFGIPDHDPLGVGSIGAGVNMALRRSVLEKVGPFDEALGIGTPAKAGEEKDIFSRILSAGYRIVYDPAALCWHKHRRSWKLLRRAVYGHGVGVYAAWTRSIIVHKEFGVLKLAWQWFWREQLPELLHGLRRLQQDKDSIELKLILIELLGCLVGPWAYLSSRQKQKRTRQP